MKIADILQTGDRKAWRDYLATTTLQEAVYAHMRAATAGIDDMRLLAHKRVQHLDGEIRHPDLWP